MSVDLQAAQLAKELQLGRNEIINLCNRSFNLYQVLFYHHSTINFYSNDYHEYISVWIILEILALN